MLNMIPAMQRGNPQWSELRAVGVGWWIRNINTLRKMVEKVQEDKGCTFLEHRVLFCHSTALKLSEMSLSSSNSKSLFWISNPEQIYFFKFQCVTMPSGLELSACWIICVRVRVCVLFRWVKPPSRETMTHWMLLCSIWP